MKDIEVIGTYGNERKKIRLTAPHDVAGNVLHIYIDNWYHGIFNKVNGEWVYFINAKSELYSEDILILRNFYKIHFPKIKLCATIMELEYPEPTLVWDIF